MSFWRENVLRAVVVDDEPELEAIVVGREESDLDAPRVWRGLRLEKFEPEFCLSSLKMWYDDSPLQ
jgi:hypothetical protein